MNICYRFTFRYLVNNKMTLLTNDNRRSSLSLSWRSSEGNPPALQVQVAIALNQHVHKGTQERSRPHGRTAGLSRVSSRATEQMLLPPPQAVFASDETIHFMGLNIMYYCTKPVHKTVCWRLRTLAQ